MKKALYVGSFDPLTYGHLNILERAARLVDELIIVVSASTAKNYLFTTEERVQMIEAVLGEKELTNCQIIAYDGLTVTLAKEKDANILIRGIRSVKDFEYERDISDLNAMQDKSIETVCLISDAKYQSISSTMVKEITHYGGTIDGLVPQLVGEKLRNALLKVDEE
ncbi:pantetheine-phosphate adenylyltransferase [Alkalibacterium sp. 20]|uniref:pantetheine-phosphate adenylyltransferase n=1 Tax=Alkalibacterium sp. 20 TaxID=1798803 RepID=UPI0009004A75|nr:pantetheine-phosphate adenylyltransferase [Alkalibacterium sp. 20]OJF92945.1 hypothetical protein AX762_09310 [Alkalibacterium sp. 20]